MNETAMPPHIWVMLRGIPVPVCKFCGSGSLQAQTEQPLTQGAGPCLGRIKP